LDSNIAGSGQASEFFNTIGTTRPVDVTLGLSAKGSSPEIEGK
jgi:hypothetical protein